MYVHQNSDETSVTSGLDVSAVKQPSSGQCRTYTRYNISVHSVVSHNDMGLHRAHTHIVPCICSELA